MLFIVIAASSSLCPASMVSSPSPAQKEEALILSPSNEPTVNDYFQSAMKSVETTLAHALGQQPASNELEPQVPRAQSRDALESAALALTQTLKTMKRNNRMTEGFLENQISQLLEQLQQQERHYHYSPDIDEEEV
jgi:hypothetical protein